MEPVKTIRHILTVEPVSFLFYTSMFLQNGGGQQFVFYKVCFLKYNQSDICWNLTLGQKMQQYQDMEDYSVSATSHWVILLNLPVTIPAIFTSICFGAWSDKYGRKPMMILPAFGFIVLSIFYLFEALNMEMPLEFLIIGNLIAGICGGFVAITFATFSYIADVTTKENRTVRMGILQSMTFSSSIVGLLTSGIIVENRQYGFIVLYCLVASCNVILIVYTQFWLPESIGPNKDAYFKSITKENNRGNTDEVTEFKCKVCCTDMWNPRNFKIVYQDVMKKRANFDRFMLFLLFMSLFILQIVLAGDSQIFALYAKDSIHLSPAETGYYTASKNAAMFVVAIVTLLIVRKLNLNEIRCCICGILIAVFGFLGVSLARSQDVLWAMLIFLSPVGVAVSIVRGAISKTVSPEEQGSVFAALSSLENLMVFVAVFIFNSLYPVAKGAPVFGGGYVYFYMAQLLLIPFILMMWVGDLMGFVVKDRLINDFIGDVVT
ncbi:proton-coupled folate transporter-like [Anneissia japonica]|uniref:proton-coupled folate transporter-like n=1 Tax=Anneissia japonica TaxID=1529436 RepID=UPI0014255C52|nr:proton-coupled folate transporter-like [Anneissia japonica]XP_033103770.1 proton-coupled folate transporter-like [Anneissia japonica]